MIDPDINITVGGGAIDECALCCPLIQPQGRIFITDGPRLFFLRVPHLSPSPYMHAWPIQITTGSSNVSGERKVKDVLTASAAGPPGRQKTYSLDSPRLLAALDFNGVDITPICIPPCICNIKSAHDSILTYFRVMFCLLDKNYCRQSNKP